ncbi:MAG TPA: spermine synthase [Oceanipulchritudo sp.]|nr:spermine synthase [Oceanipulchritudo sp.]
MKPRILLAEARTPDGGCLILYEHDGRASLSLDGRELMHSGACASEILLGKLGLERVQPGSAARVLVGGLGLGYTLRSVLDSSGPEVRVDVLELIPEVLDWNRGLLGRWNGDALGDERVTALAGDVRQHIGSATRGTYAAILLDIDNGPVAMVAKENASLYSRKGIRAVHDALAPGGRAVLWSAGPDNAFKKRLLDAGFTVRALPAKVHERAKRAAYLLYVADK